ncbi:unnamed protein product [Linum trigynum]|uniref:Uncharacterized protein n=1 Tax=Linum trigynum TaxID=586398 RepID=A0AAV2E8J2_9ROSI
MDLLVGSSSCGWRGVVGRRGKKLGWREEQPARRSRRLGGAAARRLGRRSPRRSWEEQEAGRRRSSRRREAGLAGRSSARGERWVLWGEVQPPQRIPAASKKLVSCGEKMAAARCWLRLDLEMVEFCYFN